MAFNEDTRVKIPAILHLIRLGYEYISLKDYHWNAESNIFPDIFNQSIQKLNPDYSKHEIQKHLNEITLLLDNDDLGKAFYEKLLDQSDIKIIDLDDFYNNTFNIVTELIYKNDNEEFRPDITLLINGMPLIFVEVKKPNNKEGILAERERVIKRCQNKKFKRFFNITQMMIFSNNMEYDEVSEHPLEGVFYASSSYKKPIFNFFREEETFNLETLLSPEDTNIEKLVLKDNNYSIIKHNPDFITNKAPDTPTNRVSTSLLSHDRLKFLLQYGIAYVDGKQGNIEKHIMRYPQIFATKAIEKAIDTGTKKGIIWHTQGSGKTALAYYNVKHLTHYFQEKSIIPKFYFIVDRLDLLNQAHKEFTNRGLKVHIVNSKQDFIDDIKSSKAIHNLSGKTEITVVNIQKFADDPNVINNDDYDVNIQRIYFLDEVHRSYNPKGSFLANLEQSDKNAIKIGLTGTPLLGNEYNSKALFGNYIHKYYYNKSIADGYTLRLIREEITTNFKMILQEVLEKIKIAKGDIRHQELYAHENFVYPMLEYMTTDFENFRKIHNDNSIGGMVICDSSDQAKKMFEIFQDVYANSDKGTIRTAALILHDIGTKKEREAQVDAFKAGDIDFLFVYNMLLTGFDAPRLKKLYLGRKIKSHNLLQALTRVNRTYKNYRYGYVVDFADISNEFDATNKAYFQELQNELGDELEHYSNLFLSKEVIIAEIEHIKDVLFLYNTDNKEEFSRQISAINDKKIIQALKKALENTKHNYNMIRLLGYDDLLNKIDIDKIKAFYNVTSERLGSINLKERLENKEDISGLLNTALEDVIFSFHKIGESELKIAEELKDAMRQAREGLAANFDQKDPEFMSLKDELERLFRQRNLGDVSQKEMQENIGYLTLLHEKIKELNRQNNLLKAKYNHDTKYARTHKRIMERSDITQTERHLFEALYDVKNAADDRVLLNYAMMDNDAYFKRLMMPLVITNFKNHTFKLNAQSAHDINNLITQEYMSDFNNN
ncbi:MAG: type I restriction enzyme R subunit [Alphaproteobacteria bacterium]|jgi:type I restriction enzyme R subunit